MVVRGILKCCFLDPIPSYGSVRRKHRKPQRIRFINTSSLFATTPVGGGTLYCGTRAARDMAMGVVAKEVETKGVLKNFKSLNWAPGPMKTSAVIQGPLTQCDDKSTAEMFQNLDQKNNWVDPNVSAETLVSLLELDEFDSGSHVDFFDQTSQT
eukprot:Selendium_serpulae@DN2725_c0_g1_i1.p1